MGISQRNPEFTGHDGVLDEQHLPFTIDPHSSAGVPVEGTMQMIESLHMRDVSLREEPAGSRIATWIDTINDCAEEPAGASRWWSPRTRAPRPAASRWASPRSTSRSPSSRARSGSRRPVPSRSSSPSPSFRTPDGSPRVCARDTWTRPMWSPTRGGSAGRGPSGKTRSSWRPQCPRSCADSRARWVRRPTAWPWPRSTSRLWRPRERHRPPLCGGPLDRPSGAGFARGVPPAPVPVGDRRRHLVDHAVLRDPVR